MKRNAQTADFVAHIFNQTEDMQQEAIEVGKLYGDCGVAAERRGMHHALITPLHDSY